MSSNGCHWPLASHSSGHLQVTNECRVPATVTAVSSDPIPKTLALPGDTYFGFHGTCVQFRTDCIRIWLSMAALASPRSVFTSTRPAKNLRRAATEARGSGAYLHRRTGACFLSRSQPRAMSNHDGRHDIWNDVGHGAGLVAGHHCLDPGSSSPRQISPLRRQGGPTMRRFVIAAFAMSVSLSPAAGQHGDAIRRQRDFRVCGHSLEPDRKFVCAVTGAHP